MTTEGRHIYGQVWLEYDHEDENTAEKLEKLMDEFIDYIIEFAEARDASIPNLMQIEDLHGNHIWEDDFERDEDDEIEDEEDDNERIFAPWDRD